MTAGNPLKGVWDAHAAQWKRIGPPLRPCPQDVRLFGESLARWANPAPDRRGPRALLLGVTPELALMEWPRETRLLAVDRNPSMIRRVWPAPEKPRALAVCGAWETAPAAPGTFDIALGDGCFTNLSYPNGYRRLAERLHEALSPQGLLTLRFFTRPPRPEGLPEIRADLEEGRTGSFHAFKWRLAMAVQGMDAERGVRLDDVWKAWDDLRSKAAVGIAKAGWTREAMATIENYRGAEARYTFPSLEEVRRVLKGRFREEGCAFGDYELADRCPILSLRPIQ